MTTVSLVTTVKDEASSIDGFLASLRGQSRAPDEIVCVDGGSSDGTFETLDDLARRDSRVTVFSAPGTNISTGRNIAIQRARGPIIAVADAGTTLDSGWLQALVAPLEADSELAVSSGFFVAGGDTWFERCLSTVITPQLREIDPETFLPSSRSVAFRKEWWERVGGYPEWLRHCEDLVFDFDLRRAGARFVFTPEALVTWRARSDLRGFFRQYFNYARGDGHAHLWLHRHAARYLAYGSGVVLLKLDHHRRLARTLLAAGMAVHFARYLRRVQRLPASDSRGRQLLALAATPPIVVTGDVAKMLGYLVGLKERQLMPTPRRRSASGLAGGY